MVLEISTPIKRCRSSGVEHFIGNEEVGGSIPLDSTSLRSCELLLASHLVFLKRTLVSLEKQMPDRSHASANMGFGEAESSVEQTTYSNSQLLANNGTLNINTAKDANIIGANLMAKDVLMNIGGNLTLKSKQNLLESDSYNIGLNVGISGGQSAVAPGSSSSFSSSSYQNPLSGGVNGGGGGFNIGSSYQSRAWVDNQTSITSSNSVNINVGTKDSNNNYLANTGNTDIIGAVIANISNINQTTNQLEYIDNSNLTLNTKSLSYSNLHNYNNQDSNNFSSNLQVGKNPNEPTTNGNLHLQLSMMRFDIEEHDQTS